VTPHVQRRAHLTWAFHRVGVGVGQKVVCIPAPQVVSQSVGLSVGHVVPKLVRRVKRTRRRVAMGTHTRMGGVVLLVPRVHIMTQWSLASDRVEIVHQANTLIKQNKHRAKAVHKGGNRR
jgi:hypothetical protein